MVTSAPATVLEVLERNARATRDAPALLAPERVLLDHGALLRCARDTASRLRRMDVGMNAVVALSLPEGGDLARALLGAMLTSAAAPIGVEQTVHEVDALLDGLAPRAALVAPGHPCALRDVAGARGIPLLELPALGTEGTLEESALPSSEDVALVLHTSGTTGRPKQVPLTHANLLHAASWVVRSLGLGSHDRCLNLMPFVHSHGLLGALLASLSAGSSVVCTARLDPREVLRWAGTQRCTWTTGSPTVLRVLLEARGTWPGLRCLRSASAPIPPDLAEALEERFRVPQIQVYGMTEAYQIAANPMPPGERRHGSVGLTTGCEVAIRSADGSLADPGESGEITVRGPNVFGGYGAEDRASRAETFVEEWFRTGDEGRIDEAGYLHVTGRLKERINRGGEKISPVEVEHVLTEHGDVSAALCFPVADALLGEELGALIVPRRGTMPSTRELRRFAAERLSPTKVPRYFWMRDALPQPESGKLNRLTLSERLELLPGRAEVEELAPGSDLREELRQIWTSQLGLDAPPRNDDTFFELGGTSLGLVELMVTIEKRFGVRLPLAAILEAPTLDELAEFIRSDEGSRIAADEIVVAREHYDARILPIQPRGSLPPILFVAPAGGSALSYYVLADRLARTRPFYGLQIDIRRRSWRLDLDVRDIADAFVEGLARLAPAPPCVLGGWSFGAFVAWEICFRMRARGMPVERLIALDSRASRFDPDAEKPAIHKQLAALIALVKYSRPMMRNALYARLAASYREQTDGREHGGLGRRLRDVLWKRGARDADVARVFEKDPRLHELGVKGLGIVGNLRHYVAAAKRYSPPEQDVPVDVIKAAGSSPAIETLGWERLSRAAVRAHAVSGNHFTMLSPPHVDEVAETMRRIIDGDRRS